MDRLVAEDGNCQLGLERVELPPEGVALDGHVEERQDRRFAAGDLPGENDHSRARPEEWCAARGQVEDRLAETPALDQLTHRRAFAARQDQAGDIVEIARQAHRNALHADRGEGSKMLAEGPLEGQDTDLHRGGLLSPRVAGVPTSLEPPGAPRSGSLPSRSRASVRPGPSRPRR